MQGHAVAHHAFYRVEGWYPLLRDFTFPTAMCDLEEDHLDLLRRLRHEVRCAELLPSVSSKTTSLVEAKKGWPREFTLQISETGVGAHSGLAGGRRFLLQEDRAGASGAESRRGQRRRLRLMVLGRWRVEEARNAELYDELLQMLHSLLLQCGAGIDADGPGAFVRLSTRSPKDALRELKLLSLSSVGVLDGAASVVTAAWSALRVQTAEEALDLLLSSERVVEDIRAAEFYGLPMPQLVARQWMGSMDPTLEFRLFVADSVLTAACSYHADCYVPAVLRHRTAVERQLRFFWNEVIRPLAPSDCRDYTVDVVLMQVDACVTGVQPSTLARVIEVNHPPPVASTILFDWTSAADHGVLTTGPFELRVVEKEADPRRLLERLLGESS